MSEYYKLGQVIKSYRIAAEKSVEDLSGAVEVDPKFITKLEEGKAQPPQDILELIINHLDIDETEADELWKLAGYQLDSQDDTQAKAEEKTAVNVILPENMPILYCDMVNIVSNKYGVVLNFVQGVGPSGQPTVISRVGMSHDHAKSVLEVLQKTLEIK